jgi:hypothetical protein
MKGDPNYVIGTTGLVRRGGRSLFTLIGAGRFLFPVLTKIQFLVIF